MGKEAINPKNPKEANIMKLEPAIRKPVQSKSILDKPKALQTSKTLVNTSRIDAAQCENNSINDKLDMLISFCRELSAGQIEIRKKLTEIDQCLKTVGGRVHIEPLDDSSLLTPESSTFSKEMIEQAKTRLSVDIEVDLVHNGKNLLRHSFNYTNINTFGTTLLSELFKLRELNAGTVEPTKSSTPSLDQKRVDLIKVCYLKKLKTIEAFEHYWPSIVKSLRQKCIDVKSNIKKKGHLYFKLQEELIADGIVPMDSSLTNDMKSESCNYDNLDEEYGENTYGEYDDKVGDEAEQMEELGLV